MALNKRYAPDTKTPMIGKRFGRLVIVSYEGVKNSRSYFLCQCDCGVQKEVQEKRLKNGETMSCGCRLNEIHKQISINSYKHGNGGRKDASPEFKAWCKMRYRCLDPNCERYKNYGGRGIKICDRWADFKNFLADMGAKPFPHYSLERVDNDGNYCPENCKWIPYSEQTKNRTNSHWIEFSGERMILSDWARRFEIDPSRLCDHLKRKSIEDAMAFFMKTA